MSAASKRTPRLVTLACVAGLVGCLGAGTAALAEDYTPEQLAVINAEEGITNDDINVDQYPGKLYMDDLYAHWANVAEECAPEIRTLPDGRMVQRTPTEYYVEPGAWQQSAASNSWNTYWLDADSRGCESCHPVLNDVLRNLDYAHPVCWNDGLDNQNTIQQCLFCHSYAPGYIAIPYEFGTLIHSIHYGRIGSPAFTDVYDGNCMSCHNATENGAGMELWDLVKYDHLWGIIDIADVEGEFTYDQERVQGMKDVFSYDWLNAYYDNMRRAAGVNGVELAMPQSLFDTWPITVEGTVNEPFTTTLGELVAEAEAEGAVVTKTSKMSCNWNPIGGSGVTNTEITGIPVSWLVEKAGGYQEGTTGVRVLRADGSSKRAFPVEKLDNNEVYLVYKIGGEYLDSSRGFPCMNWCEGGDAQINSKQLSTYLVTDEDIDYKGAWSGIPSGWHNADGIPMNRPNATILGIPDGLIIQNGEPFTFNGYAEAFCEQIKTLEFSMDRGQTWTEYDLGDTDVNKLVWWHFTFTPEQEGAYTLTVRATTTEGTESFETMTVMVNAKDVMPTPEETTQLTQGILAPIA